MARIERSAPISAERGGGRGRRDPALRQRIAQDRPVPAEGTTGQSVNLNDLSDEEYQELVERGIIDDGDEGEVEIDLSELADEEQPIGEYELLSPGDVVYAKVHHPVRFDSDEASNFSYGVATHIQDGESEQDAFERVSLIVNTRALNLAQAAMEPVMQFKDEVHKARKEAIDSRRALRPRQSRESE